MEDLGVEHLAPEVVQALQHADGDGVNNGIANGDGGANDGVGAGVAIHGGGAMAPPQQQPQQPPGNAVVVDNIANIGEGDKLPPTPSPTSVVCGTYNIQDGRNSGIVAAIQAAQLGNYNFLVVTETKILDNVYCKNHLSHDMAVSKAVVTPNGGAKWGIDLISRDNPEGWHLELLRFQGPNALSFMYRTGNVSRLIIGCYLPPNTLEHLPDLEAAFDRFPNRTGDVLVISNLNADLSDLEEERSQTLAAFFSTFDLFDMLPHFWQRKFFRHRKTWWQCRTDQAGYHTLHWSWCNFILGSDRRIFKTVSIRDPRNFSSDHYALKTRLLKRPPREHLRYLHGRKSFPLKLAKFGPLSRVDSLYQEIKENSDGPAPTDCLPRAQWMSQESIPLLDERASYRRRHRYNGNRVCSLTRQIKRSLNRARLQRTEEAAEEIGSHLNVGEGEQPNFAEAYRVLKRWYRHSCGCRPKPMQQDMIKVSNNFSSLYACQVPLGQRIPVLIDGYAIRNKVPEDIEIQAPVRQLKSGKAPEHSWVRAEDFKRWLDEAHSESTGSVLNPTQWNKVIEILQHVWSTGELPQESAWTILACIPKGNGDHRGIGLTDVLFKLFEAIIDTRVKETVQFHDTLHGFLTQRGCPTAIMELKLAIELAGMEQIPLFELFINLCKAYDTMNRERALKTAVDYGMGENTLRLIWNFWEALQLVLKECGLHGSVFKATRGTTQGGLFSPTLFKMVVNNVIWYWLSLVINDAGEVSEDGFGATVRERLAMFYADDGAIGSRDRVWLQEALTVLVTLFQRVGLDTITVKTKSMTFFPGSVRSTMSGEAFVRDRLVLSQLLRT